MLQRFDRITEEGIGLLAEKFAISVYFKEEPHPYYVRPRPVPYALRQKAEKAIKDWESKGILKKINYSDWAHPVVYVGKKDGTVRLCADFKAGLNRQIYIEDYPLPRINEIFDRLGGSRYYSKLDLTSAYMHLPVKEESRKYFVINTHLGLYQFTRMPMGYAGSPANWQRVMDSILADIPGVLGFQDDIIVSAKTRDEHSKRLAEVLKRLHENDLRLNMKKCSFFKDSITFCGFEYSHKGIAKCFDKVTAVVKAATPTNVTEVRSFLGLVQFYSSFVPKLAEIAFPLYRLLQKDVEFKWSEQCERSFRLIKEIMTSDQVLVPFDTTKPVVLATDASPFGVSAILSHRFPDGTDRPIAFYSRVLTPTEQKYSQYDKEALAIKEGVRKFMIYLYGRRFKLITDNKPVMSIFAPDKAIPSLAAARLQRYAIFLSQFTYDIVYRKSSDHGNVDALSRLPTKGGWARHEEKDQATVFYLEQSSTLPMSHNDVKKATEEDSTAKELLLRLTLPKKHLEEKWNGIPLTEFAIEDGVLLRGSRIYIPEKLRKRIVKELHVGHFGINKMKAMARNHVWWPNLDKELEQVTKNCSTCVKYMRNPPKERVHLWEYPKNPWHRLHMDFAGPINGVYLFIVVDAFSKWVEVFVLKKITSQDTIRCLKELFARFGSPFVIVTDNGPQFVSSTFKTFLKEEGVGHKLSAPYHPATNGEAERFVQTVKGHLIKLMDDKVHLQEALLLLLSRIRNQPNEATGESPAKLMLRRPLRDRLSMLHEVTTERKDQAAPQNKFKVGERVALRIYGGKTKWTTGVVARVLGPRNLLIQSNGVEMKRHVNQLRHVGPDVDLEHPSLFIPDTQNNGYADLGSGQHEEMIQEPQIGSPSRQEDLIRPPSEEPRDSGPRRSSRVNKGIPPRRFPAN